MSSQNSSENSNPNGAGGGRGTSEAKYSLLSGDPAVSDQRFRSSCREAAGLEYFRRLSAWLPQDGEAIPRLGDIQAEVESEMRLLIAALGPLAGIPVSETQRMFEAADPEPGSELDYGLDFD